MAENRKGRGQGLYYWTRGQLLILAVGFTVTSVVVFFLGILIGQGIEERKLVKKEEPLIKIPVQPLARGSAASGARGKEEMTFYEQLAKKAPSGAPATRVEPAKEIKPAEKAVKPAGKETKAPVQEEKVAVAEKVAKVKPAEKAEEKVVPEKTTPIAEAKKETPTEKLQEREGEKAGGEAQEKVWTVQVNAYPLERDAKNLAKKLTDKGYDAYVVSAEIKGKSWYRVRVGRFATREDAKGLQETLKTKENFTKAMTVSR